MADLAFGISKTAILFLADKVKKAIKEESEQWKTVERDLVFITGEFEMMQSFLDTVTEEHVKNKIVRTWVHQVRDLSNDVEDNIDFVLHLDPTKKFSWWLRLVPSYGKTGAPLPVDEAVAETTLLRARVVDVSQRNIRYNLIVDSASKPMAAKDLVPVQKTAASSVNSLVNAVKKSDLLDIGDLISKDEDSNLHVVSVCGTEGDLVNVAIVRKMYSDPRIHKKFMCRAWVKLVHPFNPHEFIRSLVMQFFRHSFQEQEEVNVGLDVLEMMQQAAQGDLMKEFGQKENNNRYLIVLEDLCSMVQWDEIRSYLPDRKKGSRIIVLTHHPVVASQCTGEPCRVSKLRQFAQSHSVDIYYKEGLKPDRVYSLKKQEPYHLSDKYGLLGRERELVELFELAQKSHKNRIISVWGMPSVGKSTLVKALYDGKLRTNNQFKRHAWVSVSHPFNPTDFCQRLLVSLQWESTSSKGKHAKGLRPEDPIKDCRYHLSKCVCLLVIDGLQSNEEWDWIKSNLIQQYKDSGSCVVVITSEESVAKHCAVSIDGVYNVSGLDCIEASWLFKQALDDKLYWLDYDDEANFLLSKCGGLPGVIITVARYLASKPRDRLRQEISRLSGNFMHVIATNPEFDPLRGLLAWMDSFLHGCPRHLRKFVLYLSIFPEDIIIRRSRLIRRWIAEGYSKGTDSISTQKYTEKIFDEVATLSIMEQVVQEAKVIGYRVNGFFREYVMSRPAEETILFPVEISALENHGHGYGRLATDGIGQHLAIRGTMERDRVSYECLDFSRLRSLTLFQSGIALIYFSHTMRVLRVLDLEDASYVSDYDLEQIGRRLSRLKYLSVRRQRHITRLPESVGCLLQLQTLDLRDTCIDTLPPFITKLRKLQYIRAGTTVAWTDMAEEWTLPSCSSWSCTLATCLPNKLRRPCGHVASRSGGGVEVPRGIYRMEALLTLGAVRVNTADGEAILNDIISLPQLKKLEISGINGKQGRLHVSSSTHLESLSLQLDKHNHLVLREDIYIPSSLRSLKMYGHVQRLPCNIPTHNNLAKLTLEMTTLLTAEVIGVLGSTPNLQTLRLRVNKNQDGELRFPAAELFKKLQVLEIACKSKLHVTFNEGGMANLEQLKLHCHRGSKMQFSGLEHVVHLKQVWLLDSFEAALEAALEEQLEMHPKIPAPKLEVPDSSNIIYA